MKAIVKGHTGRERVGRGFSKGELKSAGLTLQDAKKLGIYVDKRRRSVHEKNVEALKELRKKLTKS